MNQLVLEFMLIILIVFISRRFKKKKETRLAVERMDVEEDLTVSLQAGLRYR